MCQGVLHDTVITCSSGGYYYEMQHFPEGYSFHLIWCGGGCSTFVFEYEDSCMLYIHTKDSHSPNMRNVLAAPKSAETLFSSNWALYMYEYRNYELSLECDTAMKSFLERIYTNEDISGHDFLMIGAKTIDLHGEDEHGLCWREIMTPEGYCYGYLNVKKTAKDRF